jgi:hypothetical protein
MESLIRRKQHLLDTDSFDLLDRYLTELYRREHQCKYNRIMSDIRSGYGGFPSYEIRFIRSEFLIFMDDLRNIILRLDFLRDCREGIIYEYRGVVYDGIMGIGLKKCTGLIATVDQGQYSIRLSSCYYHWHSSCIMGVVEGILSAINTGKYGNLKEIEITYCRQGCCVGHKLKYPRDLAIPRLLCN